MKKLFFIIPIFLVAASCLRIEKLSAEETPREEEEAEYYCGKEIPNGEALELAADLSERIACAFLKFDDAINAEIEAAKRVVELSQACTTNNCTPQDCGSKQNCKDVLYCQSGNPPNCISPTKPPCPTEPTLCGVLYCTSGGSCTNPTAPPCSSGETQKCPKLLCRSYFTGGRTCEFPTTEPCLPYEASCPFSECEVICEEPKECLGSPCDNWAIETNVQTIDDNYEKVKEAEGKIQAFISGTFLDFDETESLCIKKNEDIRSTAEEIICKGCPVGTCLLLRKSLIDIIGRKLNRARRELDDCYISPEDWKKVQEGTVSGRLPLNCEEVFYLGYPFETKTTKNDKPICTSQLNWFCCY